MTIKNLALPSRRNAIKALGGAAFAAIQFGRSTPALAECALLSSPSLTEGPYFVDEDMNRADIRVDPADGSRQEGMPLALSIHVAQLRACAEAPLTGAYVDIWHSNAAGIYSDVAANGSVGKKFLRGYQPTDRHGNANFTTVYPGWYQGRAVHIHAKVRVFDGDNKTYEFTSQFFFDEDFSDDIYKLDPYSGRGKRNTFNDNDGIYRGGSSLGSITSDSGAYLMLKLDKRDGYVAGEAKLLCDLSLGSSPSEVPGGGGGPGGGGPPPPR